ncbi:ankyrin repeat domain-containing protein SOWAHC [Salminus brasiliensis]|uniref:ankyrin repeat domain-containing protein SOWAHC n=1 Tax=Salminus brasiliensis TaxID=930266 RepID=UPI003B83555E
MATECTQEAVLEFLLERGGRVRNKELTEHFRGFLTGEKDRSVARETFKRFVDNIAYVKQEDREKMVCLRKKHREMKRMRDGESALRGGRYNAQDRTEDSGSSAGKESLLRCDADEKPGPESERMPCGSVGDDDDDDDDDGGGEGGMDVSETVVDLCVSDIALVEVTGSDGSVGVIDEDGKHRGNGPGTVREACEAERDAIEVTPCPTSGTLAGVGEAMGCRGALAAQLLSRRRTSRGSQRSLLAASDDGASEGDSLGAWVAEAGTPRSSRRSFVELMMSSSPQVRRNLMRRGSQGQMAARRRESLKSDGDSGSVLSSVDEDCASVTLDPLEHEWMMCASDGEWDSLQRLLDCEPSLVTKKDFVTGFTCLHWAAKQGKHELLALLVAFARKHSVPVNVNARSSAGYTPLHLAAMHNHVEVMKLLVGAYDADLEARDYSGRKPSQYLDPAVAGDIQDIVGACKDSDGENAEGGPGRWRLPKVLQSNLNPLRLLNPLEEPAADGQARPKSLYRKASIGRMKLNRGRIRTQIVHSTSFRETEEGNRSLKSPVKSRPVSNLFG